MIDEFNKITAKDLKSIDWNYLRESHTYIEGALDFARFGSLAKLEGDHGNLRKRDLLFFLSWIASLVFHPEDKDKPYQQFHIVEFSGGTQRVTQWASVEDLRLDTLLLLGNNLDSIEIYDLKARIADLIYIKTKDEKWAYIAINNFNASVEELKKDYIERIIIARYTRILMIANDLKDEKKVNEIKTQIRDFVKEFRPKVKNMENLKELI